MGQPLKLRCHPHVALHSRMGSWSSHGRWDFGHFNHQFRGAAKKRWKIHLVLDGKHIPGSREVSSLGGDSARSSLEPPKPQGMEKAADAEAGAGLSPLLDKGHGKAAEDTMVDNWAASPDPASGEKSSPGRNRCQNGLRENAISATGWQLCPRISHQSLCLLHPKILAAFLSPTCQEELCSEPSSHTVFSKLPLPPHLTSRNIQAWIPTSHSGCVVSCLAFFSLFPCAFGIQSLQGRLRSSLWHLTRSASCTRCSELLCELHWDHALVFCD